MDPQVLTNLLQIGVTGVFCVIFWKALEKRTDQFIKLHEDSLTVQTKLAGKVDGLEDKIDQLECQRASWEGKDSRKGRERGADPTPLMGLERSG